MSNAYYRPQCVSIDTLGFGIQNCNPRVLLPPWANARRAERLLRGEGPERLRPAKGVGSTVCLAGQSRTAQSLIRLLQ